MSSGRRYYWDACPLIAWITDESTRTPQEKAGLEQVAEEFEKGSCIIVASSLFRVEILTLSPAQQAKLDGFCKRRHFQEIEVSRPILNLANEIRQYYKAAGKTVQTPDSIHLATAIKIGVDVFHTFDGAGRKRGLLDLSGNVAGHNLVIQQPFIEQQKLPLGGE